MAALVSSMRVVAAVFDTVTVTALEVVVLPAASRAIAVIVCDPLAAEPVSHGAAYGADVSSAPTLTPSTRNWTPTTPTLSDAAALSVTVSETVTPDEGAVTDTVGG